MTSPETPASRAENKTSAKTAVFVCSHHTGHLNPILSLVPILDRAGWKIHFFCCQSRQSKIESKCCSFHPDQTRHGSLHDGAMYTCNSLFQIPPTKLMSLQLFFEQILPATVSHLEDGTFVENVQSLQPSLMVCDVSALWGILAARVLEVPLITSCSCMLFDDTALQQAFGYLPDLEINQQCVKWIVDKYPKIKSYDPVQSYMNESDFVIAWSVPQFQPPTRQDDSRVHYYGSAMPRNIDAHIEQLKEKDKQQQGSLSSILFVEQARAQNPNVNVIYCTLGTVIGQEPWTVLAGKDETQDEDMVTTFYRRLMTTLGSDKNYAVILSIGPDRSAKQEFGSTIMPSNFLVSTFVPQLALLTMVDAFITHCGNNSVHEALFLKCPMLCVPVFGDQHPNAASIARVNCGVAMASPFAPGVTTNFDHVTTQALVEGLNELLVTRKDEIQTACAAIQTIMREKYEHYHSRAVKEIEAYVAAGGGKK